MEIVPPRLETQYGGDFPLSDGSDGFSQGFGSILSRIGQRTEISHPKRISERPGRNASDPCGRENREDVSTNFHRSTD